MPRDDHEEHADREHAGDRHLLEQVRQVAGPQEERVLGPVIGLLETSRIGLINLTKREPTLEDVFVDLVGRSMEEVEDVVA